MKLLLLVNSSASSVTPRVRVTIQEALQAEHDVTVAETSRRGHASSLAKGAAAGGFAVVVVLGGDGTINEAANGLAATSTALGVLPGGSTNVFARTIGFTNDPVTAAGELIVALREPARTVRRVGLASANGRYFLFHAGMGFDAAVVEQVERRGSLKRFAGHPLFVYAGVTTWLRYYDRTRPRFDITASRGGSGGSSEVRINDGYFAIALKTNPYTFLGNRPLNVAPEAGLDTGLSVLALQTLSVGTLTSVIAAALMGRGGPDLDQHKGVAYVSDVTEVDVCGHGAFPYQLDGDYLGEVEQLEIRYHPAVLDLVVPKH